jgi:dephospho-CoA kinase
VARGGLDAAAVEARIDAQLSNQARRARADVVIDNGGDEAALGVQIDAQWRRLQQAQPARARA